MDKLKFIAYLNKINPTGKVRTFTKGIAKQSMAVVVSLWEIKDNSAYIKFNTSNNKMVGGLKFKDFNLPDSTFGITYTVEIVNFIETFGSYLEFCFENGKLEISDGTMLYFKDVEDPKIHKITSVNTKSFDTEIDISYIFHQRFISSVNGTKSKYFYITVDGTKAKFVIGDSSISSEGIIFSEKCTDSKYFAVKHFDAGLVKSILQKNRDYIKGILRVKKGGLIKFEFSSDDYFCEYHVEAYG